MTARLALLRFALLGLLGLTAIGRNVRPDPTVLIVDDEEDVRLMTRLHLESHGFRIVGEASNGAAAVADSWKLRPDFIVMDHQMPYLTGRQASDHIQEIAPESQIVVFSASLKEQPDWAKVFLHKTQLDELGPLLLEMRDKGTTGGEDK